MPRIENVAPVSNSILMICEFTLTGMMMASVVVSLEKWRMFQTEPLVVELELELEGFELLQTLAKCPFFLHLLQIVFINLHFVAQ